MIGAGDSPQQGTTRPYRVGSAPLRASGVPERFENTGPGQGAPDGRIASPRCHRHRPFPR